MPSHETDLIVDVFDAIVLNLQLELASAIACESEELWLRAWSTTNSPHAMRSMLYLVEDPRLRRVEEELHLLSKDWFKWLVPLLDRPIPAPVFDARYEHFVLPENSRHLTREELSRWQALCAQTIRKAAPTPPPFRQLTRFLSSANKTTEKTP